MHGEIIQEWQWLATVVGTIVGAFLGHTSSGLQDCGRLAQRNNKILDNSLVRHCRQPLPH